MKLKIGEDLSCATVHLVLRLQYRQCTAEVLLEYLGNLSRSYSTCNVPHYRSQVAQYRATVSLLGASRITFTVHVTLQYQNQEVTKFTDLDLCCRAFLNNCSILTLQEGERSRSTENEMRRKKLWAASRGRSMLNLHESNRN